MGNHHAFLMERSSMFGQGLGFIQALPDSPNTFIAAKKISIVSPEFLNSFAFT
jgi:hypothetical protein